jgi:uncharacterized membrane protein YgdD (TMEM256/DUF423 family)
MPMTMAAAAAGTSLWLRLAALSGASAVALGAYGAHAFKPADTHFLDTFDRGNKYHLIHSLLLAVAPHTRCSLESQCAKLTAGAAMRSSCDVPEQ